MLKLQTTLETFLNDAVFMIVNISNWRDRLILQDPVMLLGDVSVRNFAALSTVSSLCLGAIIGLSTLLGRQACFVHGVTIDDEWMLLF